MKSKGFLLFEVVVSIVIITAGLLFIMHSYSSAKNSIERSNKVFKISLLLESRMWEFEERGEITEGQDSGNFEEDEEYSWKIDAHPLETEDFGFGDSKLSAVKLEVFKEKERKNTTYTLWTYLKSRFL